uniref:Uncharacterized protein n=1 Tax=Arundo donax TaxID=35708 RepID=A0A0A8XTM4_ARUDO
MRQATDGIDHRNAWLILLLLVLACERYSCREGEKEKKRREKREDVALIGA